MIRRIRHTPWEKFLPWALDADQKVWSWVMDQSAQVQEHLRLSRSPWIAPGMDPLRRRLRPARQVEELQAKWQVLKTQTRTKAGEVLFHAFTGVSRRWLGAKVYEVELSAGTMRYWKTSPKHQETILFFHGFADSMDGAYHLAYQLRSHYNMIVPDLPGFGLSFKRPDVQHTYENYGAWLREFVDTAAVGPVHVVGNSLGGAFALMLAQLRPDLVKSLTLLNTAAITDFRKHSVYDEFLKGDILFQVKSLDEFEQFWSRIFHKQPFIPPLVREFFYQRFRENHDWYGHLISQIFTDVRSKRDPRYKEIFLNQHLAKIQVPALIIWGEKDRLFPVSFGQRGHKLLKNSRFVVLEDVGHAPQVEAPEQVARLLQDFIAEVLRSEDPDAVAHRSSTHSSRKGAKRLRVREEVPAAP